MDGKISVRHEVISVIIVFGAILAAILVPGKKLDQKAADAMAKVSATLFGGR